MLGLEVLGLVLAVVWGPVHSPMSIRSMEDCPAALLGICHPPPERHNHILDSISDGSRASGAGSR